MAGRATPKGTSRMWEARVKAMSSRAGSSCGGVSAMIAIALFMWALAVSCRTAGGLRAQPPVAKPGNSVIPPSTKIVVPTT